MYRKLETSFRTRGQTVNGLEVNTERETTALKIKAAVTITGVLLSFHVYDSVVILTCTCIELLNQHLLQKLKFVSCCILCSIRYI